MKLSESIQMEVISNQTKSYHINQTLPNQLLIISKTAKTSRILMKLSQNFQMDAVSNQTNSYQTKPFLPWDQEFGQVPHAP